MISGRWAVRGDVPSMCGWIMYGTVVEGPFGEDGDPIRAWWMDGSVLLQSAEPIVLDWRGKIAIELLAFWEPGNHIVSCLHMHQAFSI